jgi:ribosomal-protein-serine acetyltransferase
MQKILRKEEIELKTFTKDQASLLFSLVDKNRDYIREWLTWVEKTKSINDVEIKIKELEEKEQKGEGINFGIWYKNKLVGVVGFNFINKEHKKAAIGYWLDKDYQGKGIMTASCRLLIGYGFNQLGLHRIEISCATGNNKSCAIPQRLGFTREGKFRESGFLNGKFVDHYYYSLLDREWVK